MVQRQHFLETDMTSELEDFLHMERIALTKGTHLDEDEMKALATQTINSTRATTRAIAENVHRFSKMSRESKPQ